MGKSVTLGKGGRERRDQSLVSTEFGGVVGVNDPVSGGDEEVRFDMW